MCDQGGVGGDVVEGADLGVHPQERGEVPLHVRDRLQPPAGRAVRGELREELPDHVQARGFFRDSEEVLHSKEKDLQWARPSTM